MAGSKDIHAPFLGTQIPLTTGLNQLGMRSVGEQLFTTLLPGLNNVSDPLRYYSFYCWVIKHLFDNEELEKVTLDEFRQYIRPAEYLLALVCSDQGGIPGVTLARKVKDKSNGPYLLDDGTKSTEEHEAYFKNPGGAFIQYFASSMANLDLVHSVPDKKGKATLVYNTTTRGCALGEEFGKAIGKQAEHLFFKVLQTGAVSANELNLLRLKFDMHKPSTDSEEWRIVVNLLVGPDFPQSDQITFHRRQTIKLALEWFDTEPIEVKDRVFVHYLLDRFYTSKERTSTLWGWYSYAINEEWQYQSSIVFSEFLTKYLKPKGAPWLKTDGVVLKMAQDILSELGVEKETSLSEIIATLNDRYKASLSMGTKAILDLLLNYDRNESMLGLLDQLRESFDNLNSHNFFTLMRKIKEMLDKSFEYFLIYFIKQEIILRHYIESFRKMSQTGIATQKFVMEGGFIRFLASIDVDHSSPRLTTLINFLKDLGLIEQNKLTEAGQQLLKDLKA